MFFSPKNCYFVDDVLTRKIKTRVLQFFEIYLQKTKANNKWLLNNKNINKNSQSFITYYNIKYISIYIYCYYSDFK